MSPFAKACFTRCSTEFPAVGYRNYNNGALTNAGTNGNYWSATQNNGSNAYNLNFTSSSVSVTNNNKTNGLSVRCVRPRIYDPDFLNGYHRAEP